MLEDLRAPVEVRRRGTVDVVAFGPLALLDDEALEFLDLLS